MKYDVHDILLIVLALTIPIGMVGIVIIEIIKLTT